MPVRNGPTTVNSGSVRIGLMQVRIGASASNIAEKSVVLGADETIGVLANTKYMGNVDWWKLESGYPASTDAWFPIREDAAVECSFLEQTPWNLAIAHGLDPNSGSDYDIEETYSGEIKLGARSAPAYVRAEIIGTYPNGTNHLNIVFPRAQVTSSVEIEDQKEEGASIPITITATPADQYVSGGDAAWDSSPLGRIYWD